MDYSDSIQARDDKDIRKEVNSFLSNLGPEDSKKLSKLLEDNLYSRRWCQTHKLDYNTLPTDQIELAKFYTAYEFYMLKNS